MFLRFLFFGLFVRLVIVGISQLYLLSFYNSDALGFYEKSLNFNWENIDLLSPDSNIFVIWNKLLFILSGNRMWVGQIFSVLSWAVSFYFLSRILNIFLITKKKRFHIYLFYSLLPSCIIYTSGFMRESYELLFCNILILYYLLFSIKPTFSKLLIIAISGTLLFLLHEVYFIVFAILIFLLFHNKIIKNLTNKTSFFIYFILCLITFYFLFNLSIIQDAIEIHSIGVENVGEFRANYIDYNFKYNVLVRTFQFLFEPLPLRSLNSSDIIAIVENIIKFYFLYFALSNYKSIKTNIPFIFLIFITVAWSMFTYNWGTSIRHQVPQLGVLLSSYAYARFYFPKSIYAFKK